MIVEVPELNDGRIALVSGQQRLAIVTPVETKQVIFFDHVLGLLIYAQIVHFNHFIRDRGKSVGVERVKVNAKDVHVASLFDLTLLRPVLSDITDEQTVSSCCKHISS